MSQLLSSLPLLACPVGMGLMMWMMMRGGKRDSEQSPQQTSAMTSAQQAEVTQLRAELDQLRAEDRDRGIPR